MYETIDLEIEDRIAYLTIDRPEEHNSATPQLFEDMVDGVAEIEESDARVVIFTGAGDEAFSAGVNIPGFEDADIETVRDAYHYATDPVLKSFEVLEEIPIPVIAVVNGFAYGFGMGITLPCDIVIASDQSEFRLPEVEWGLVPVDSLMRGIDIAGRRVISYYALTNEPIPPQEAKSTGLVNEVVPHDELYDRADELAEIILDKAPLAQEYIKRILNIESGYEYEWGAEVLSAVLLSEELEEGVNAFKENRNPDFEMLYD